MEADLLWRLARRELVWCQMLVRSLAPTGVCLLRSIAFCTYLRALGLPATLVIGRACFDLSGHAPFHAWVELAGLVVNDHAELQSGYRVIQRLPLEDILGVLRATGWDGVLSVELFREEYWWLDPLTVAREAKARTMVVWERVLQHDGR